MKSNLTKTVGLIVLVLLHGCASDDLQEPVIDCSQSSLSLSLSASTDASGCTSADGTMTVNATGGTSPYSYSLSSASNSSGTFDGLTLGSYEVKVVDASECERTLTVNIGAAGATLSMEFVVSQDTECQTNNGSIAATVTGGTGPYEFKINGGAFGPNSDFSGLASGTYSIEVKDSQGCVFTKSTSVARGNTGISFAAQIQPIINTKCALTGCHNGDNGAERNWTVFSNVKTNAANIKTRTGNGSMPATGSLTQEQINLIACWVDDGALDN